MLISLVAPRRVVVGGAELDVWADNVGQRLSCALAAKAWNMYGENMANSRLSYYERQGTHFLSRTDWIVYMEAFRKILNEEKGEQK